MARDGVKDAACQAWISWIKKGELDEHVKGPKLWAYKEVSGNDGKNMPWNFTCRLFGFSFFTTLRPGEQSGRQSKKHNTWMQRINRGVPRDILQLHGPLFLGTLMAPRHRPGRAIGGEALKLDEMSGMLRHVSWYLMGLENLKGKWHLTRPGLFCARFWWRGFKPKLASWHECKSEESGKCQCFCLRY